MKKNVLMLINGFGIEQSGSYNVYTPELMPFLDELTKKRLFKSLSNTHLDYKTAYRKFSMGIDSSLTHNLIDKNIGKLEYEKNPLFVYIINELNKKKSNCHLICYWDSYEIVDELIPYVREIEVKTNKKIFLHFILNQKSLHDYKSIGEGLSKLSYEFGQRVKIGIISGEDSLNDKIAFRELMKCFLTEAGEKWKDINKKMEVFVQNKTQPYKARTFAVNYGFRIEENDQILFFNYYSSNITNIRKELFEQKYRKFDASTIGLYSLFPLECDIKIPFMYNYVLAGDYFLKNLDSAKVRCLILDTKERCIQTNYYLTGLRNQVSENLKYVSIDDKNMYEESNILDVFNKHDKELYIFNYEIESCKTIEEIKDRLNKIDKCVGILSNFCQNNKYGFVISSLYGLEREMYNAKAELCKINFYSKVPVVIQDDDINLVDYVIKEGDIYDLANTLIYNCNNNYENMGLLKKKSKIFSFLYKKPSKESISAKKTLEIENGVVKENGNIVNSPQNNNTTESGGNNV